MPFHPFEQKKNVYHTDLDMHMQRLRRHIHNRMKVNVDGLAMMTCTKKLEKEGIPNHGKQLESDLLP